MLSVRLILAILKIHNINSEAIYFVLAFPQVGLKEDIWMHNKIVFHVYDKTEADSDRYYTMKLYKSINGLKQDIFNWYENIKAAIVDRGFKPSDIDPFL